ncbi:hypothetical protein Pdw03_3108 [Penicillium digitatum]|uniref:Uncharacterized protein n=1 Tax=Penicillium digitatum TaxID=36651 RepID=A0A7T6XFM1_PENDI|nr:hypothetical protein Pdw03_3108 [Penicillium digitatum]
MVNLVARNVRLSARRLDCEIGMRDRRLANPNRINFNSDTSTTNLLPAIDSIDLKLDTGVFVSAVKVDWIEPSTEI